MHALHTSRLPPLPSFPSRFKRPLPLLVPGTAGSPPPPVAGRMLGEEDAGQLSPSMCMRPAALLRMT